MSSSAVKNFVNLTKPTIIFLVAITGFAMMMADGSLFVRPYQMILVLIAIIFSAASANAFNQVIDRDIDAIMERTRSRRPLPLKQMSTVAASSFALLLGVVGNLYLWIKANEISALISIATILFYIFVYTLWLKRRHHYNIVIGGAAGATAPLIASAAVSGTPQMYAWILFAIIFFWTPPHFWALALAVKDEYNKVHIPMLPNVRGDRWTRIEIILYTWTLLPISLLPFILGYVSLVYAIPVFLLWLWYIVETYRRLRVKSVKAYRKLFFVSIAYLFLLFVVVGFDGIYRFYFQGGWAP